MNRLMRCAWVCVLAALGLLLFVLGSTSVSVTANLSEQQAGALVFADEFDSDELDLTKWSYTGTVTVRDGWLTLHGDDTGAEVRGKPRFSGGTLRGVIHSSDWVSYGQFTDLSFGFEVWTGGNAKCHYGIVLKANGHLGVLRAQPDANGDCTGDPLYQEYVRVSNWETIRAGSTLSFTLTWCSGEVTLRVSGNGQEGQAAYAGQAVPTVPLEIRLYAEPFETYQLDFIRLYPCHAVYLPIVVRNSEYQHFAEGLSKAQGAKRKPPAFQSGE